MRRVVAPLTVVAMLVAVVPAIAQQRGGYAGQQNREIKALSPQETADLLAGRGMGMARAAELNSYPGPMHVLELRDQLGLSDEQVSAAQVSFRGMQAAARQLGAELVEQERMLDGLFRSGTITPARMTAYTEAIGLLQGRLRTIHLAAHLEMRELLTSDQIARYDDVRGYIGDGRTPGDVVPEGHGMHRQR